VKYTSFAAALLGCACATPALAQSAVDQNVFVFGGRYIDQYFEYAFNPLGASYEDNFVLGAGYQRFVVGNDSLKLGVEVGAALRAGDTTSTELWAGPVLRADKFIKTDLVNVSASVTAGLSVATGEIGIEAQNVIDENGDNTLLYYLGPELSFSLPSNPDVEVFWRVHHRSGGWKTLGNMRDSANAVTVGLRVDF
jgi:hypothetical protein